VFPTMKVHRRLLQGSKDNIWEFYRMMRSKLEGLASSKVN
jgi:hypothetical protein